MFDIVACAQDGCDMTAELLPVGYSLNPTGGYIVNQRVMCVAGHVTFTKREYPSGQETSHPPVAD